MCVIQDFRVTTSFMKIRLIIQATFQRGPVMKWNL